jgi:hypothetical protein
VFKSEGQLYKKIAQSHLANDDTDEIFHTQETIQLAVYDMTLAQVIIEYGPVEVIESIENTVKDQIIIKNAPLAKEILE